MAWRQRNATIDTLLERVVGILERQHEPAPKRGLSKFHKNKPSHFRNGFDPDGAQHWLEELEKIFEAMTCSDNEMVVFATFMLAGEAKHWWRIARQQLITDGTAIDWPTFRRRFLEKYFPEDLQRRKELEFLNLEQGGMSIGEYVVKFDELSRYCSYFSHVDDRARCSKFESVLRPDIKQAAWKGVTPRRRVENGDFKRREIRDRKKPYNCPDHQQKRSSFNTRQPDHSGQRRPELCCYSCGGPHLQRDCRRNPVTCFRCGQQGHYSSSCHMTKNDAGGSDKGRNWNADRNNNGVRIQWGIVINQTLATRRIYLGDPIQGDAYTQ
ncbi:uncharacterized protein LOC113862347 [Abrus precatorius]|uniref:Uncharacterized protein LOC113862347 n=1 Tax=Abrus precatorius TaxID=3816 RepID=A0A8B8L4L6_ABRPR|nr:uncharacterized protein LOC113862347 [Abrus precatorius]